LPQFVSFVGEDFKKVLTTDLLEAVDNVQSFTGCVKLNRVFREEVVITISLSGCIYPVPSSIIA
jgi:hypothetical protein